MFLLNQEDFKKFGRNLFYFFVAVFPFLQYRGFIFNGTSSRAMNLIIVVEILAISLGIFLFKKGNKISIPKSPITISLFLLLISLFVSSILGVDFNISFWSKITRMSGLYYFIHLGFFYLFTLMLFKEEVSIRKFIKVFVISSALFSLGSFLSADGMGVIFANREWSGFTLGNSTFAAMYIFAGFILSLYLVLTTEKSESKWWHKLVPLPFIISPYFINYDVWNGSINLLKNPLELIGSAKASFFGLVASVFVLFFAWIISKIKSVKIRQGVIWSGVVVGIVTVTLAFSSLLSSGGLVQNAYLKTASAARPIVWSLSKNAINEKPLFGWGVDNFDRAYESQYDNSVIEKKNGGEAWFDRAHNIFIDQTIETGYVGVIIYLIAFLSVIASALYVIFKSKDQKDKILAVLIIAYFVGHLMELQTAFDTTISYMPVTIMAALASIIFHKTYTEKVREKSEWKLNDVFQYSLGVILVGIFTTMFFVGTFPIFRAQLANGQVRTIGSSEKRLPLYPILFGSPVDTAGFLNRTVTDIQGGISVDPSILQKPGRVEGFKKELAVFAEKYQTYLNSHPDDYRARIKMNDLYIYQRLFEVNNLSLAQDSADKAIALVPQAPQAYWQKSVAYLYARKFDLAKEWAQKAYDLNPNIEESVRLKDYIDRSIKTFPVIDLYNFKQI